MHLNLEIEKNTSYTPAILNNSTIPKKYFHCPVFEKKDFYTIRMDVLVLF